MVLALCCMYGKTQSFREMGLKCKHLIIFFQLSLSSTKKKKEVKTDWLVHPWCTLKKRLSNQYEHSFIHSFIHSGYFYSTSSSLLLLRDAPDTARIVDTVPEFHAKAPQASKELAQGPYVAARAGVEPMTRRTKGVDSTKAPPRPTNVIIYHCRSLIFVLCYYINWYLWMQQYI